MDGQGEIEQVQGVLTEFSRVEAGLAALRAKHGNTVYEVSTTAGMDAAKAARAEIREPRFAVEKVRKAAKAPLLAIGRRIDAEAVRITEAILAIETPIDDQIKAEEARRLAEKEAKRAAEVERLRQEAAEKLRAEEERLAAERAAIAAERKKAEEEAAEARRLAEAEAAAARRKAEIELAAQRKAIEEERARIQAEREAAEAETKRIQDAQIVEARRLAEAQFAVKEERRAFAKERERRQALEEAERNAAEAEAERLADVEDQQPATVSGEGVSPMAIWEELWRDWEGLCLNDSDAVENFCRLALQEGEKQAAQLIKLKEQLTAVTQVAAG
jgi:chromosome segregation ATPase